MYGIHYRSIRERENEPIQAEVFVATAVKIVVAVLATQGTPIVWA